MSVVPDKSGVDGVADEEGGADDQFAVGRSMTALLNMRHWIWEMPADGRQALLSGIADLMRLAGVGTPIFGLLSHLYEVAVWTDKARTERDARKGGAHDQNTEA